MSDVHKLSLDDLFREIDANGAGLTQADVSRRQTDFGPNELRVRQDVPEIAKFLLQFRNFFALLLIFGGTLVLFAEHLDPGQGNLYIALALFAVVLLNAVFTYLQERQSERIMESFARMLPAMVTVVRDGRQVSVLYHWGEDSARGRFLSAVRDAGCGLFNTVLGPDYNVHHQDHFHFDLGRSRVCR